MKKNRNMITKLVSVLLMIAMLVLSTEMTVIALADASDDVPSLTENVTAGNDEGEGTAKAEEITEPEPTEADLGTEVFDVVDYREANVKHFYMGDGTYQALTYPEAVHRKDANGTWQDIDNDLFLSTPISMYYQTKDARVRVAKNPATAQYLTRIAENGYEIKTSFLGISGNRLSTSNMPLNQFTTASVQNAEKTRILATDSNEIKFEKLSVVNNTSRVTYANLLNGVDVTYSLTGNTVKEDIVLNQPIEQNVFTFKLDLAGLVPTLEASGRILLADEESEETVYVIMAPYMIDATGAYSMDVYYELTEIKNGSYLLTVTADKDWLASSERAYPVTIDPTITTGINCYDTYISSTSPNSNHGAEPLAYVSSTKTTYLRIVHPDLAASATMRSASLNFRYYITQGSVNFNIYMLLSAFSELELTYTNSNTVDYWERPIITRNWNYDSNVTASNPSLATIDVTTLLEMWYEGWGYYGIMLVHTGGAGELAIKTYESQGRQCPYYSIVYDYSYYPIDNGTYFIDSADYLGYVQLDEQYWPPTTENIPVHLQLFDSDTNQQWTFEYLHNGYYKITNERSGKVLASPQPAADAEGKIPVQQEYGFTTRHQWQMTEIGINCYTIKLRPDDDEELFLTAFDEGIIRLDDSEENNGWVIRALKDDLSTAHVKVLYDEGFEDEYDDETHDQIRMEMGEMIEIYYFYYNIFITYDAITLFQSLADQCTDKDWNGICECEDDNDNTYDCVDSIFEEYPWGETDITRFQLHHTNADNIISHLPLISAPYDFTIAFIGHTLCHSGYCNDGEDNTLGAAQPIAKGLVVGMSDMRARVLIHEVGHMFGIKDHYNDSDLNNADCLYGENRFTVPVTTLCTVCANILTENASKYE